MVAQEMKREEMFYSIYFFFLLSPIKQKNKNNISVKSELPR